MGTVALVSSGPRILLWTVFVTLNTSLVTLSQPFRPYFWSPTIGYYQRVDPSSECPQNFTCGFHVDWPRLNHTLIVRRNSVESLLQGSTLEETSPTSENATLGLRFTSYASLGTSLVPHVTGGMVGWSGTLATGDTAFIRTTMLLPSDGVYFIGGFANLRGYKAGMSSTYFLEVRWGVVVSVSRSESGTDMRGIEARCLEECWP